MCANISICIVQPDMEIISETFLRAHAQRLPASTTVVHGFLPCIGNKSILSSSLPCRAYRRLARWLSGKSALEEATEAYASVFRLSRASVVLAEYGPTGVHVLDACERSRVPLVVHFHGFDASEKSVLEKHATSYPRLFRSAAAIIAVSRPMQQKLISLGAPSDRVHYNPYGVDCQMFMGSNPASAPPVLLAVGRFVEKKAPHLTIAAFAEARRSCATAQLRMIGDGPLMVRCRDLVEDLGLGDAVKFLGPQPSEIVRREMREARGFVQHSVQSPSGDCEGMPVGILEAGASGLPVVASRHAGIPDAVVHGETGLLVEERDVRGMAAAMQRVLHDPVFAGSLGQAARRWICTKFNLEDSIHRLWLILRSCIGPRGEDASASSTNGSAAAGNRLGAEAVAES